MKARIEAPIPDQLNPVLVLQILGKGTLLTRSPGQLTRGVMEDAEMLADVKAYDAAKARLENGGDELVPLEIIERRLSGEPTLPIWPDERR